MRLQIPNLIDTLKLAREFYELPSNSLLSIAEAFHVPMTNVHRALDDAHTARGHLLRHDGRLEAIQQTAR